MHEVSILRSRQWWWRGDQGRKRHEVLVHDLLQWTGGQKSILKSWTEHMSQFRFGVSEPVTNSYTLSPPAKRNDAGRQPSKSDLQNKNAYRKCLRPIPYPATTTRKPARRLLQEELMAESPQNLQLLVSFWKVCAFWIHGKSVLGPSPQLLLRRTSQDTRCSCGYETAAAVFRFAELLVCSTGGFLDLWQPKMASETGKHV